MQDGDLKLIEPCPELEAEFRALAAEYLAWGTLGEQVRYQEALADFGAYLRRVGHCARGLDLPPGQVPYSSYWLVRDGTTILAGSTLRHWLTDALKVEGGHIGYGVRPSQRGQGYGRLICALTLEEAGRLGLRRVLVTCDTDNVPSARVILANGGVLEGESRSPRTGKMVCRYWIDL